MRKSSAILKTALVVTCALTTLTSCSNEAVAQEPTKIDERFLPSERDPFVAPERINAVLEGEFEQDFDDDKHSAKKQTCTRGSAIKSHAKIIPSKAQNSSTISM